MDGLALRALVDLLPQRSGDGTRWLLTTVNQCGGHRITRDALVRYREYLNRTRTSPTSNVARADVHSLGQARVRSAPPSTAKTSGTTWKTLS